MVVIAEVVVVLIVVVVVVVVVVTAVVGVVVGAKVVAVVVSSGRHMSLVVRIGSRSLQEPGGQFGVFGRSGFRCRCVPRPTSVANGTK